MPHKLRIVLAVLASLLVIYLSGPVIASVFEIGDRRGPRIYPIGLHESIYMTVWEFTPHEATKPRLSISSNPRPWFYGL